MSHISPELWQAYFGDKPMPDGCTYEQFTIARDVSWRYQDLTDSAKMIKRWTLQRKRLVAVGKDEQASLLGELIKSEVRRMA